MKLSYNKIMEDGGKEIKILSIYKKKENGDTNGDLYHIPMTREELDVLVIQLRNLIEKI